MPDDVVADIDAWFDGTADEAACERLERALITDAGVAARFAAAARLHQELCLVARNPAIDAMTGITAHLLAAKKLSFERRRWLPWIASAAACLALSWWLPWSPSSPPLRVEHCTGGMMQRAGNASQLAEGAALQIADLVEAADGKIVLARADGSLITLAPGAALAVDNHDRMRLVRGSLRADVAHQDPRSPLQFAAADAEATVIGTRLALWTDATSTRLEVQEGRVRFGRADQGSSTDVVAGEYAEAAIGGDTAAYPLPGVIAASWRDDCEALAPWGQEPFGHDTGLWPIMPISADTACVHDGRRALRLRYRFPAGTDDVSPDDFAANYQSVARAVVVPPEATLLRLWLRRISSSPHGWLFIRLRDERRIWESMVRLAELRDGWQAVEIDLVHPPRFWSPGFPDTQSENCPPVDNAAITHLVFVAGGGDFDVALDDIEIGTVQP
jgi:ferric-dicitrate binding protein FerR (iron transport regulator)